LIAVLFVWGASSTAAADPATPAQASDPAQRVLVMMRLPPDHARPGAGYGDSYGGGLGRSAQRRVAARIAQQHGLVLTSDWPMPMLGIDCYTMVAPADQSPAQVAETLSRDPQVAWAQPINIYHARGEPTHNDPLYRVQPAARAWRLAELHQIATGRRVRVAVIDSMVEKNHPDLAGQVDVAENFVSGQSDAPEQHGTGVAGVIAARADNGIGIAGIAPRARLMALRACWQKAGPATASGGTICDSLDLAKALDFAVGHNAQVINLSLSGPPDLLLGKLIDIAVARGATVIGAYDRALPGGGFPASHPGVVPVVDSGSGPALSGVVSAPGRDVPTTQPGGRWYFVDGSSYAAAHVSGLFALLRERSPPSRTLSALVVAWPGGAIDTCATLLRASGPCGCACAGPIQASTRSLN
jgi:subtilisin family serine protease